MHSMSLHSLYDSLQKSSESEVEKYYLELNFTDVDPDERENYVAQHFEKGKALIDTILDQFRWIDLLEPASSKGVTVSSWTHCEISQLAMNGRGYLVVNDVNLRGYLESYLSDGHCHYIRTDEFDWAIADMLVYTECRLLALQSAGTIPIPGLNSLLARIFIRKKKLLDVLNETKPFAYTVYSFLGKDKIDWIEFATQVDHADRNGVGWRSSVQYLAHQLASNGQQ